MSGAHGIALTKPAACQSVPQTDALAQKFGALSETWPVISPGQYGALILFGTCILSWAILRAQSYSANNAAADTAQKIGLASLSNPSSILLLARESAIVSCIFLFAFACEYFPIFASTERAWNVDDFAFYALLFLALTLASVKKVKDASMLNRLQTDEWKGWMQWLFIMYHYCAASSIYNFIRVFICAYVWMTGYGNFIYFTTTGNFCLGRFIHMMWRLNFAVVMLMLVMNKSWMVYYICPLHTFYFVLTFLVCFVYKHGNASDSVLRYKILFTFLAIAIMWDAAAGSIFTSFWGLFLSSEEGAGGTRGGTLWEWYFRTSLDKYACAFGMLAGLNREKVAEILGGNAQYRHLRFLLMGLSAAYMVWWWGMHSREDKHEYNKSNAFFAPCVVMAFVVLRNCSSLLRQHYFAFPAQLGRISLESYLLQYHIWLACSATRLLVLIPGLPKVNLLATSAVFLLAANLLFEKTAALKVLLFADTGPDCVVVVCKMMLGWLGFHALGMVVYRMEMPIAAGCTSLVLALGVSHLVKRSASSHQHPLQPDQESAQQGFEVESVGPKMPAQHRARVWVGFAAGSWGLVCMAVWLKGVLESNAQEVVPVYRVPAGQYSNTLLGAGTCLMSALLLAATARIRPSAAGGSAST